MSNQVPSTMARSRLHSTELRLLQTTDMHMQLLGYDYAAGQRDSGVGLARTALLIEAARQEVQNSLLFDCGDILQGTFLGDWAAQHPETAKPHPAIQAMNALHYDAATLGNHDFGYDRTHLTEILSSATFPWVLSNVVDRSGRAFLPDRQLLEISLLPGVPPLKLGLLGFVPPQTALWERQTVAGRLIFQPIPQAARAGVKALRQDGADLIIALNHSGIEISDRPQESENSAIALAEIDGIDGLLCGHQHRTLPGPAFSSRPEVDFDTGTISGKPAVMAGCWGRQLGIIDLQLTFDDQSRWSIAGHRSALRPLSDLPTDLPDAPQLAIPLRSSHAKALSYMEQRIGETRLPLRSYFPLIGDDLPLQLVARAKLQHVETMLRPDLPVLAAVASFKASLQSGPDFVTDVPAGPLTRGHLADLYMFPNRLSVLRLTATEVEAWLEHSASIYATLSPGCRDQPLIRAHFPSYGFDHMIGLRYRIDLSQPPRYGADGSLINPESQRVRQVTWQGQPLHAQNEYLVATGSFRANGGGGYPVQDESKILYHSQRPIRSLLEDYIRHHRVIDLPAQPVWDFDAPPGTEAVFKASPRAQTQLSQLPRRDLQFVRPDQAGYGLFRLRF